MIVDTTRVLTHSKSRTHAKVRFLNEKATIGAIDRHCSLIYGTINSTINGMINETIIM